MALCPYSSSLNQCIKECKVRTDVSDFIVMAGYDLLTRTICGVMQLDRTDMKNQVVPI